MSEVVNLEELCTGIIDCPHSTPKWQDKGIPVIRNYNLKDGKIDCTNLSFVSEEDYKERVKRAIPEESDIIISREAPMGVVGIVPKEFQCCLGQRLVLLKIDKSKCLPKYLLYTLMSEYVQVQIRRINQTGSIVSNLNISSLKELKIPLHNFEEQRKITNILSAIDDKIQINNQINQELEAMAKTLYDYWFVQFDFPDQNGKPYKSSGGKMVYHPELKREIPEGWGVEKLGELAQFKNGINYEKTSSGSEKVKIINVRNISSSTIFINQTDLDEIFLENDKSTNFIVNEGMILITRSGIPGATRLVSELEAKTVYSGFIIASEVNDLIYKNLIFCYLKNVEEVLKNQSAGTIMKNISQSVLTDMAVSLPPQNVLLKFNSIIDDLLEQMKNVQRQNQELTQLRDWLLPMLMNGQVKVE